MHRFLWLLAVLCGFCLLACTSAEPVVITRTPGRQTAVTAITRTPSPTLPLAATTRQPTATVTASPRPTTLPATPAVQDWTATPTPSPTVTAVPSPTAVVIPTLLTPIQRLAAGQTLPINNDLLFIDAGELQLWQPQTGQVNTLLTPANANRALTGWRSTPDGQTLLVAQTPINDVPGFTLFLFDARTRQVRELWTETDHYLFAYALATDGRSAAMITSTTSTRADEGVEVVKVIDNERGQVTILADCPNSRPVSDGASSFIYTSRCQRLTSVPDSQTWLWRDIEGVWQGGLQQPPRLLVPHDYFDDDPPRIYNPTTDWSPDGRYQLLTSRRFEGSTRWVLDMTNGQTIEVPNSGSGLGEIAYWQWTQDNRLFTVRPPIYVDGEEDNFAELWHVEGDQLVPDASLALSNPDGVPSAPGQLPDGRFAFVINHTDPAAPDTRNLYLITSFDRPPQPLVSLPPLERWNPHEQSLTWTPDASGVLYILPASETYRPFYIPADGSVLNDLTNLLGNNITDLIWLS